MFRKIGFIIGLAVWGIGMSSCGYRSICEAQITVKQADSLWRAGQMYGREAGDSTTLAQAYETLNTKLSSLSPQLSTTFAHACYHYGRLLRERENPAAAMECFINATHTRTRDYHILGRVYSNIGDICHLAGEFPLSYDMFERSANNYLKNGDTLLYYYGMYRMAYELAEQGRKEATLVLIDSISHHSTDAQLYTLLLTTRVKLYKVLHQYDSVLYYANSIASVDCIPSNVLTSKAQAFCYLHQYDSATYYAKRTIEVSTDLFDLNNAYYILIHCDSIHNGYKVYSLSADRADVQKLLEIRQGKLSQAVQLLQQDLDRKPDFRWLYAIIATVIIIGGGISVYVYRKRRKHKLISQKVEDLQQAASKLQEKHDNLTERYLTHQKRIEKEIETYCKLLRSNDTVLKELVSGRYDEMCNAIDRDFHMLASKLHKQQTLTEPEVCLCILVFLGLTRQQIADLLHYANSGIGKFKYRVALKLGVESKHMREFLINMALDE